ncbi:MAG: alpha-mannosidase, partial [Candidatus Korarchaeota archaeon]
MSLLDYIIRFGLAGLRLTRRFLSCFGLSTGEIAKKIFKFPNRKLYCMGHSHIDAAWLWTRDKTVAKARRTFENALLHMKKYRFFTFAQSAPQYYLWMEKYFPHIFSGIKEMVKEGRWEPVGGLWVEPDTNMPDGEAFVRHELFGQRYYLSRFGKTSEIEWLPDSFGFAWTLPQIFAKSGVKYFWTTKITWNDTNTFPFAIFEWKSPDGSKVLTYMTPLAMAYIEKKPRPMPVLLDKKKEYNYAHPPDMKNFASLPTIEEEGIFYGIGDGGGGPVREEILIVKGLLELGNVHTTPSKFFKMLDAKYRDHIPVWNDELYLEFHRGVLTSQALIKRYNRQSENKIITAEMLATIA